VAGFALVSLPIETESDYVSIEAVRRAIDRGFVTNFEEFEFVIFRLVQ